LVDQVIEAGKPWTDLDFQPNVSSLYDPEVDTRVKNSDYDSFIWRRVSEIYPDPQIFDETIEPNDIKQGALGDCYLLAVLSSLAENKERIEALFVKKEINKAGIYAINFFINGLR